MVCVKIRSHSGQETSLDIDTGMSLMEGAVRGGIDGIDADCGGQLACATCHVYVDSSWLSLVPPMEEDESDMLEHAIEVNQQSRLSCQIMMTETLDGLIVQVPERQR